MNRFGSLMVPLGVPPGVPPGVRDLGFLPCRPLMAWAPLLIARSISGVRLITVSVCEGSFISRINSVVDGSTDCLQTLSADLREGVFDLRLCLEGEALDLGLDFELDCDLDFYLSFRAFE